MIIQIANISLRCSIFRYQVERVRFSAFVYSIETVLETDDRTRLGVENTRPDTATKSTREREKGRKGWRKSEKEREGGKKKREEDGERESMGISTKHVTIKEAGGCESSLD